MKKRKNSEATSGNQAGTVEAAVDTTEAPTVVLADGEASTPSRSELGLGAVEDSAEVAVESDRQAAADAGARVDVDVGLDVDAAAIAADPHLGDEGEVEVAVEAAASSEEAPSAPAEGSHLESILESLLFAADRPLTLSDLKRLLGERDGKRVTAGLESLQSRRASTGIQLVSVAGGWQLRTHPANGAWVAKLVTGRPPRLSRAMMETLSIVAYRQPITRPEIDEIRGVDCGPVLKTLLDRALVRVIGKREEVGRPILYGTTPEFLQTFSLRDLAELPTLREFHELAADDQARVNAQAASTDAPSDAATAAGWSGGPATAPAPGALPDADPEEEDSLLDELDQATVAAGRASQSFVEPASASADVAAPAASDAGEH